MGAHLEKGLRLSNALEMVPRLLPAQIRAMLKAGERIGDVNKVLPACRLRLKDGVSQVRGALNYVILLAFLVTPFTVFIPLVLRIKVLPSFNAVFNGMMEGGTLPAFTRFVFATSGIFMLATIESCLYSNFLDIESGIFHPSFSGTTFRLYEIVIPLALLARLTGKPRSATKAASKMDRL